LPADAPLPTRPPHPTRTALLVALSYLLLAVVSLYPQSVRPWDTIAYIGDSLDTVYFMSWNAHQLFHDPLHLFDANVLYPTRDSMALAGHRMLPGLLSAPIAWFSGNPILAYNVVLALVYVAIGLTGRFVARLLGLPPIAAWAAGALYAFNSYEVNEAPRLDLLFHFLSVLALVELVRVLRGDGPRHAWAAAGLMLLQGLASNYLLLYGALLLGVTLVVSLIARPRETLGRLPSLVLPALVALLLFVPVILPHVRSSRTYGFTREPPRGVDLQHYVSTIPTNLVYGAIGAHVRPQQQGPHFVGFVSLALALVALVGWRRLPESALLRPRVWVPAAAVAAALLVALSLGRDAIAFGHDLGPGPYRLLHAFVPGFAYIRIPERLSFFALFFVALLAGAGVALVQRRFGRVSALLLAAAIPAEHVSPLPLSDRMPVGASVPAVYRWLKTDSARAVAEVPVWGEGLVRKETVQEYFSTYHYKPIVHGYVSYPPLLSILLRRAADQFPGEGSVQAFARVGVDTVIVHEGREGAEAVTAAMPGAVAAAVVEPVARFEGPGAHVWSGTADAVYRLRPVQPVAAAPLPGGRRLQDAGWDYRAREGDARAVGDGDPRTAWAIRGVLRPDDALEIRFGRPLRLAGVVVPLDRSSAFPTQLRLEGLNDDGSWRRLGRLDTPHLMQLVDQLRAHPGGALLGFDLSGRGDVAGVRLVSGEGASSFEGWSLAEVEVRVP
jgi:hypothetical protein